MGNSELDRTIYDSPNEDSLIYRSDPGLTRDLVVKISNDKNEPEWMLKKRLEAFEIYEKMDFPKWGPILSNLDMSEISLYIRPDAKKDSRKWEDVPDDIKNTFEKLGIPEAERKSLGGVGAQYESEVIYHNIKEDLKRQGVVFLDMDEALKEYPELVEKYFMTSCVNPGLHKFSALHGAVWSGGSFIYVPKGLEVELPLQAYFRMNSKGAGQFEHTLIIVDEGAKVHYIEGCSAPIYDENSLHAGCVEVFVLKGARMRYSSIENWSKNTYNLNTKRAIVFEDAVMEWVNGNLGSNVTMLYPCSVLKERGASTEYLGIAYAGKGQNQDTGCKVYHLAPETSSFVLSKSISAGGGITMYRGLVKIKQGAFGSKSSVACDGLMLDNESKASTLPAMNIEENDVKVSHEAAVGRIGEEQLFYLMSRGLSEEDATKLIVSGYIEPLVKELPLEYAVELNRLIELEIENSVV